MKQILLTLIIFFLFLEGNAQTIKYHGTLINRKSYHGIVARDSLIYAFHMDGLTLWNASNKNNLVIFKEYSIKGSSPKVYGDKIIVTQTEVYQIHIINIADPNNIFVEAVIPYKGHLNDFYTNDDKLFLAVNGNYMQVFDLSKPTFPKLLEGIKMFVDHIDFMDSLICVTNNRHLLRYYFDANDSIHLLDSISFNNEYLASTFTSNGNTLVNSYHDTIIEGDVGKDVYSMNIYQTGPSFQKLYTVATNQLDEPKIILFNDSSIVTKILTDSLHLYSNINNDFVLTDKMVVNRNGNYAMPVKITANNDLCFIPAYTYGFSVFEVENNRFSQLIECPENAGRLTYIQYNKDYLLVHSSDGQHQVCKANAVNGGAYGAYEFNSKNDFTIYGNYISEYNAEQGVLLVNEIDLSFNIKRIDSIINCRESMLMNKKIYYRENLTGMLAGKDLISGQQFNPINFRYDGVLMQQGLFISIGYNNSNRDSCYIDAYHTKNGTPEFISRIVIKHELGFGIHVKCDDEANRAYITEGWSGKYYSFIDYSYPVNPTLVKFQILRNSAPGLPVYFSHSMCLSLNNSQIYLQKIGKNGASNIDSIQGAAVQYMALADSFLFLSYGNKIVSYNISNLKAGLKRQKVLHENMVSFFPNPGENVITIRSANDKIRFIQIMDATGRELLSKSNEGSEITFHHHLPSGIYFVTVTTSGGRFTQKLIVK